MWIGTNALLTYGKKLIRNAIPCAISGLRATMPIAAANHDSASTNSARIPAANSQCSRSAWGRKPIARATTTTSAADSRLRATLAITWPLISASPRTSIERNRSMIPEARSWATVIAVVPAPKLMHTSSTPGTT